ncbi:hypothetical protein [Dictyobacter arantiisoli]|uniref:Glycosyltransferase RgtA/B/C/D-like domain-containing protein n=1 Tax=Dictyobacter arantiisoli TaxID=2014874 RepID=A0A5A5TD73_9CHLR|nr:hypothetical protein [Dictyobacter arantiisoli]GCF09297.1 hypothetical protein KDI_28610 [Dictyobacter arantiisoli]
MQAQDTTAIPSGSVQDTASLKQLWSGMFNAWWKAGRAVLPTFLVTRLLLIVLTYLGGVLFTVQTNSTFALNGQSLLYNWYHWDAIRNLTITTQGYTDPAYTALFPLYPVLIHLVSTPLHLDILLTGMLISNMALLGAFMVLFRLVEEEFDAGTAKRCLLYLALFPSALFFFTAYNSALLLFFVVLSIYLLRHQSWWLAGCIGGLATLTDFTGIFLFVLFLCEFFRQEGSILRESWKQHKQAGFILGLPLVASLLIPLGLVIYCSALRKPFHDPLIFWHANADSRPALLGGLFTALHTLVSGSLNTFAATHSIFELLILLAMLLLLFASWKGRERLAPTQWPLIVFGALVIVYALLVPNQPGVAFSQYDPLPSLQYAALIFIPGWLIMARLGRYPWVHQSYLLFSTPLLAFLVFQMFKMLWAM